MRAIQEVELEVENEEQGIGVQCYFILLRTVRQIAKNAGESADLLESAVSAMEGDQGFDFRKMEPCDMIERGIVDPAKVTITALQNAVSAAGTLITTGHAIIEK